MRALLVGAVLRVLVSKRLVRVPLRRLQGANVSFVEVFQPLNFNDARVLELDALVAEKR